jgi:urocanate hydratase
MADHAVDPQADALRAFTILCALRPDLTAPDWGGGLIVMCGLARGGAALSVASNIAGAASLAIDERVDVCRAALRSGACDFVVNSVDEALRVLKNEIRQRRPVSVGLAMGGTAAVEQLLERGVLPQLFTAYGSGSEAAGTAGLGDAALDAAAWQFLRQGCQIVDFDGSLGGVAGAIDAYARLGQFIHERGLQYESLAFASGEELRAFDARLLEVIPAGDARHRWCAAVGRFFHRERPSRRVAFLTPKELGQTKIGS